MRHRMVAVGIVMSLIVVMIVTKLFWVQLMASEGHYVFSVFSEKVGDWKKIAVTQRQKKVVLDTGRGDFVDRFGQAITGETYQSLAFFPIDASSRGSNEDIIKLAKLLQISSDELITWWDQMREADFWRDSKKGIPIHLTEEQVELIGTWPIEGLRILPYHNRYLAGHEVMHMIGFTSQHPEWLLKHYEEEVKSGRRSLSEQVGGSGLEQSLDRILHGIGETSVSYFLDGHNKPLHGLDARVVQTHNPYYPVKVITTTHLELQHQIEMYLDSEGIETGAVVVLDPRQSDVVAMVSRPKLQPNTFTSSDGSEWANHALKAIEPGSIYKLITGAAALEYAVTEHNEKFFCDGEYGNYGLSCWRSGGHGELDLHEGLAQSCNIVFATIAERLTPTQFEQTARALGVTGRIGWHTDEPQRTLAMPHRLLEEEERGRLFAIDGDIAMNDAKRVDGGTLAQSGIGQRDVRISPLHAANLIATILRDGIVMEPRFVREIQYANGKVMLKFPPHARRNKYEQIRSRTARVLRQDMEAVIDHGTGRSIKNGKWEAAGKSGTAETMLDGKARNHQWFVGYGPSDHPKYVIAVLVANQPPGSKHKATQLFRGVLDIATHVKPLL